MYDINLYESLLKQYGTNEPILSAEIIFENYSRPWIYKQLNILCEYERLIHFEKGIYYIPTQTPFGKSLLDPKKAIESKYIYAAGEKIGYYSGLTFQNRLRLTTQMPNVIELYTNNESTRVRPVCVGTQQVILRKARTEITSENAGVQSFLELMNDLAPETIDEEKRAIISGYIAAERITRSDITAYAPVFPDRVMRNLIESEVIYDVAQ